MAELGQMTDRLIHSIEQVIPGITVVKGFMEEKKPVPIKGGLVAVSIQKVGISGFGLGNLSSGQSGTVAARRMDVWFRIVLCSPASGGHCWSIFEDIAAALAFDEGLSVAQIECGEIKYSRDWGGMTLPLQVNCVFGVTDTASTSKVIIREFDLRATPNTI